MRATSQSERRSRCLEKQLRKDLTWLRAWSAHFDTVLGRDLQLLRVTNISLVALRELYSAWVRNVGGSAPALETGGEHI